ncbi:MAG: hypothetical protein A2017_21275 [Lentisphaerae bacterium GWF2_44_16]|nr:MAG: hypothetical protein A2017_21275 [Lentisphaerae bacterium GWF2_44_16]
MNLIEHILYQNILANLDALPEILGVFERTLDEKGISVSRRELDDIPEEIKLAEAAFLSTEQKEAALKISAFFKSFPHAKVIEYIYLGQKERIARSILRNLNQEKKDVARIQELLYEFCKIPAGKIHLSTTMTMGIRVNLISEFISVHLPYVSIAKNFINMRDIANVMGKSVSSNVAGGLVGGKAAGMILANRILRPTLEDRNEELDSRIEEIDAYFVKSSIISEFTAMNRLEECHSLKYIEGDAFERERLKLYKRFMEGNFPESTLSQFRKILIETDNCPLILRSSSYLEDSVGLSFSGKYDSIFISNMGTLEERLEELTHGIKQVYFSLYSANVIQYRKDNSLLDYNEKMSVLIQKVVGKAYGKYFFPGIALVGFSRNSYCWNKRIKKEDGMLRIVMGLGTRAVDRVGDDYPRIVSLSAPTLRPEVTTREKIKYSQRYLDVLNLETKQIETVNFVDLINKIREDGYDLPVHDVISIEKDGMLTRPYLLPDKLSHEKCAITFDGLLSNNKFTSLLDHVLKKIEKAYDMPVDMEFAYHNDKLYILQCRTLRQRKGTPEKVVLPSCERSDILFTANRGFSNALIPDIEYIVYVDRLAYDSIGAPDKKYEVARIVGKLNRGLKGKRFILMGPGRWGTNNIDLGIGVKYSDINNTLMLIEIAWKKDGVTPELSYGTHFFQDLVEADIIPLPLFPEEEGIIFNSAFFGKAANLLSDFEIDEYFNPIIKVVNVRKETGGRLLNVYLDDSSSAGLACFK